MKIQFNTSAPSYSPSFEKLKKVGQATVNDRQTGKDVTATVMKEKITDEYIRYEIHIGRKNLGYMDMSINSPFSEYSEKKYALENPQTQDIFPEILHLRTIEGERYSGIGSTLVKLAVEESKKHKKDGTLRLVSEKGYQYLLSPYRSNENPIPFYYKMGFKASSELDKEIKQALAKEQYEKLPNKATLVLTSEDVNKNSIYHTLNYEITV